MSKNDTARAMKKIHTSLAYTKPQALHSVLGPISEFVFKKREKRKDGKKKAHT